MKRLRFSSLVAPVVLLSALLLTASGCGFKLRGPYSIPPSFQIIRMVPDDPYDPFQRVLRQNLKNMGIQVLEDCPPDSPLAQQASVFSIMSQTLADRVTAYGPDVQVNRTLKQYTMTYQITDSRCAVLVPPTGIQIEREVPVDPNAVLGTQFESNLVRDQLYQDAVQQLMRQISSAPVP